MLGFVHVADCILGAADGVSDLAFRLVHLAFGLQLLVPQNLADAFLYGALVLLGAASDPFLIHTDYASRYVWKGNERRASRVPRQQRVERTVNLTGEGGDPIASRQV